MSTKIALFAAAVTLSLAGCTKEEPTSAVADRRDVVGMETFESALHTPPTDQAQIMPTYRAPVDQVMASVGAVVRRGEVLVQLSFPNTEAAYAQAQVNVKAAEAALAQAKSAYDDTVKALQQRVLELRKQRSEGAPVDDFELASAERELADAQKDRNRAIAPYSEALAQAQQAFAAAKSGAKQASIRTPITGTVLELNASPGQEVGVDRDQRIALIVDLEALEVHAQIPSGQQVEEGDEFVLTFSDVPGEDFEGTVSKVVTVAGSEGMRKAVIQFDNTKGMVKPGMKPTASMITGRVENVVAVPTDAVDKDDTGKPVVHVLKGSDWAATVVEVGLSGGGYTEIKSGVAEGDTVQVTP
jgi:RND family efflux transporter MFP subunit